MIGNKEFLEALFAEDAPYAHVTDFSYDPGAIPADKHLIAWKGDYACRYPLTPGTNQYFTISIFAPDEKGVARRRKALFLRTRVIVLDDVREKLDIAEANKLPKPAWILESSAGSEQWGYILDVPCADRHKVENLLDGLVANGLAPQGKDPGMKGVTRYVRLPEGSNNKASKLVNGEPFKCRLTEWNPERRVTLADLAAPFHVDLEAVRREGRVDGAADLPDHPLLQIPDLIHIKDVRSDGRFDITCPWVDEHTDRVDNGSAVFTNGDGSIGFKCHHGACEQRTVRDLMGFLDKEKPGFSETMAMFRLKRDFAEIVTAPVHTNATQVTVQSPVSFIDATVEPTAPTARSVMDDLRMIDRTSAEARAKAQSLLQVVDSLPALDRMSWHDEISDVMHWSKTFMKEMLKELRADWYKANKEGIALYKQFLYIKEQDRFYDVATRMFLTPAAFQNSYSHEDKEAKKTALEDGRVEKVDRLNFAPKRPMVYIDRGIKYGNTWSPTQVDQGVPGDCSPWLNHWDALGWSSNRDHMIKWMAFTLRHPEQKINHMLLLGGLEGSGKDFLLYPLCKAMGEYGTVINGDELLTGFNDYLLSTKHLHINEAELGDHQMATVVSNKIKPLCSAPPDSLRVNQKGITPVKIDNIVSVTMTTNNGNQPVKLAGTSRRIYGTWSDLNVRDSSGEMKPQWRKYWTEMWNWMHSGGVNYCIWYLMTQVDLTDFNPGAAPVMTDFVRDITDASKSPMQHTIEFLIKNKVGAFRNDLVTAAEIMVTLKAAALSPEMSDMIMCDLTKLSPVWIGRTMNGINDIARIRAEKHREAIRLWVVRDTDKYLNMSCSEVYDSYMEAVK